MDNEKWIIDNAEWIYYLLDVILALVVFMMATNNLINSRQISCNVVNASSVRYAD